MASINLQKISKSWGPVVGVDAMDLDIRDKEFMVFLGPSGCGKTTTMRMVAGLEDPTAGEILIDGEKMNGVDARDRDVSMVFQSYALYPNMSIYENIRFPLRMRGVPKEQHDKLVREAARIVELGELLDRKPRALSGGQRQRAALARAVVRHPRVFLMDEPLSNLDAKLRLTMRAQLKHIQRQLETTTIYVTHDQIEAMTLADRIAIMSKGKIQQLGSPDEVYNNPANLFVAGFIGSPPMNLIKGDLDNGAFIGSDVRVKGAGKGNRKNVVLGIRPEDVSIGEAGKSHLNSKLYSLEPTGDQTLVAAWAGEQLVVVKGARGFRQAIDTPIGLDFDAHRIYLFDGAMGERIQKRSNTPRLDLPIPFSAISRSGFAKLQTRSTDPPMPTQSRYSVLIIGAGINGCSVFRDLCLQGVDCLLIDSGDICAGASAAPSRLIHGGIKYLETREFRLVRESAMERNRLLRNAPHYVKALETVFPSRSWFAGLLPAALGFCGFNATIKERGAILIEIGLRIYDFYSRKVQALPDHRFFGKNRLRSEFPDLNPSLIAAGLYHEGRVTHAERLGLELVQDGLAANPASVLLTYTQLAGHPTGRVLTLRDKITGDMREITVDVVINAGGAWIDKVNAGMGIKSAHMGGSKGSHVIVRKPELLAALKGRMLYFGTSDGRFNLVYPFFGNALIGSTDIAQEDPDQAFCSTEEADYLLNAVGEVLPGIRLTRDDVILTYCGVRPLPRSEGVDIGVVTRDHTIGRDKLPGSDVPVLSLIGGKWTTFRAFSEQSCDLVLSLLGKSRRVSTQDLPIGGGRDYPPDEKAREQYAVTLNVHKERGRMLLERYGTKALAVQAFAAATDDQPLISLPGYSSGEVAYICKNENVRRLADLLLRRTAITMEGLLSSAVIQETANIAAAVLGWDAAQMAAEIEHARTELARRSVQSTQPAKCTHGDGTMSSRAEIAVPMIARTASKDKDGSRSVSEPNVDGSKGMPNT